MEVAVLWAASGHLLWLVAVMRSDVQPMDVMTDLTLMLILWMFGPLVWLTTYEVKK